VDRVVARGEPLYVIHAQTREQLTFAREFAEANPHVFRFGY
jgi:hypothetical protein